MELDYTNPGLNPKTGILSIVTWFMYVEALFFDYLERGIEP